MEAGQRGLEAKLNRYAAMSINRRFLLSFATFTALFCVFHFVILYLGGSYRTIAWAPNALARGTEIKVPQWLSNNTAPGSWLRWDGPVQYEPAYAVGAHSLKSMEIPFWTRRSGLGGPFLGTGLDAFFSPLGLLYSILADKFWDIGSLFLLFITGFFLADLSRMVLGAREIRLIHFVLGLSAAHLGLFPYYSFVYGETFNQLCAVFIAWGLARFSENQKFRYIVFSALATSWSFQSGMPQQGPGVAALFGLGLLWLWSRSRLSWIQLALLATVPFLLAAPVLAIQFEQLIHNYQGSRDYTGLVGKSFELARLLIPEIYAPGTTFASQSEMSYIIGVWGVVAISIIILRWNPQRWSDRALLMVVAIYLVFCFVPGAATAVLSHVPIIKQGRFSRMFQGIAYIATILMLFQSMRPKLSDRCINRDAMLNRQTIEADPPLTSFRRNLGWSCLFIVWIGLGIAFYVATPSPGSIAFNASITALILCLLVAIFRRNPSALAALFLFEVFTFIPRHGLFKFNDTIGKQPFSDYWATIDPDTNYSRLVPAGQGPSLFPEIHTKFPLPNSLVWMRPIYPKASFDYLNCVSYWTPDGHKCLNRPKPAWLIGYVESPCSYQIPQPAEVVARHGDNCLFKLIDQPKPYQLTPRSQSVLHDYRWTSSNSFELDLEIDAKREVTFWEASHPAWKARIGDTKLRRKRIANRIFPVFELPAGRHKVTLSYYPRSFTIGLCLLFLGVVFISLAMIQKKPTIKT